MSHTEISITKKQILERERKGTQFVCMLAVMSQESVNSGNYECCKALQKTYHNL